jgi:hypothetical protein
LYARHSLDFFNLKNAEIGPPLVIVEQGIIVRAQVFWPWFSGYGSVEHTTQCRAVDVATLDAKANDPPRELIHNDHYPMCPQDQRLATKQAQTPQAVLAVAEECQPGWATRARIWSVISGKHSPHCVLVDRDTESQGNLISNPLIRKSRVSEQWLSEAGERGGSFRRTDQR